MSAADNLVIGGTFHIRYRPNFARIDREMVAVYLGPDPLGDGHQFSGRPEFGTTVLPASWLKETTLVPRGTKPYHNRKVRP